MFKVVGSLAEASGNSSVRLECRKGLKTLTKFNMKISCTIIKKSKFCLAIFTHGCFELKWKFMLEIETKKDINSELKKI